ncbi:MAG: hypothetical protein HRU80_08220 [Ignavibacteriales bacterium]|nr:MAG: hypothetical protein HRU80_08220 [Ignavibacteriales bacterium]
MRYLNFTIIFVIRSLLIFPQDSIIYLNDESRYPFDNLSYSDIEIEFPQNSLPKNSRGIAIAPVWVDETGNIVKYFVKQIRLKDSTGENALMYFDKSNEISKISLNENRFAVENYPLYIQLVITGVYRRIETLKFKSVISSENKIIYEFAIIFRIRVQR